MPQKVKKNKIFFSQIERVGEEFFSKSIFLSFMSLLLGTLWITLIILGFQPKYVHAFYNSLEISKLPLWIQTVRAVSIFAMIWYTIFLIWHIIQIYWFNKLFKEKDQKLKAFMAMSWIPFINIGTIVYASRYISYISFKNWLNNPFNKDTRIHISAIEWKWVMNLCALIVMTPMIIMTFFPNFIPNDTQFNPEFANATKLNNMWFEGFHYFTIQTNFLCYFYLVFKVSMPQARMFRNDSALVALISYIFVVSATYNGILLPSKSQETLNTWTAKDWVKTMWEHVINPVVFITVGFVSMRKNSLLPNTKNDYVSTLKFGMIIPTVYLTYASCLPFFTNSSVYGAVTNMNNTLPNWTEKNNLGSWVVLFFILMFWFLFMGVISLVTLIRNKIFKKTGDNLSRIENVVLFNRDRYDTRI